MAAFRCAVLISPSTLLPSYSTGKRISINVIRCSSGTIPFYSKSSKRKNYLRPKILRTLNPNPKEPVVIGIETPEIFPPTEVLSNQDDGVEELQVSSSSVVSNEVNGILSKLSPKLVAKYGLYLIGIFVFQTVCAVLFLENSTKSGKTPEITTDGGSDSGNSSKRFSRNLNRENGQIASNVILLDELEMNEKIEEIRVMAREARRSEEKSGKKEEDETLNSGGGIDIEKEIEARLSNMEKRLNSQRKGLAGLRVEPLDESANNGLKDEKGLMFEKKYKFKPEKPSAGNVKGFGGSKGNNGLIMPRTVEAEKRKIGQNGNVIESRDDEKNGGGGPSDSKIISGAAQESEQRPQSNKVNKSRKSGNRVSGTPSMEAGSGFGRTSMSDQHGDRKEKPLRRFREKQFEKENKFWWLKLPYVLRILMRSNIDQETSGGYFTMRTESMEQNEGQVSHIIAFEDQIDARNFSYLLESVFEDLDDFNADVVPISTKELHNEVSSGDKNVIVVKKRQITLYAGQPFEDVERALHTLIQEQYDE